MHKIAITALIIAMCFTSFAQADSSSIYLQKGMEEKVKGRRLESMKHFEKAYSYNRENKEVVSELASAYFDLRRYPQSREKYLQLEKMGDRSPQTYKQLMTLSFNSRQFDDAIRYADLLKKSAPSEKVAYYTGKANYEKGNLGEAIKHLDAAMKEDAQNADIPYYIARSYADMQNYKQAVSYFEKAVALKPTDTQWIYEMALMYYAMNDDKNSLKYMLEAAEKGHRKDNDFLQNLSVAYLNAGKFDEGVGILKETLQRRPTDIGLLNMIAEAYYDSKKYNEAITYYDQLLTIDKTNAEALYMIGMSYIKKGEKEKGQALCDRAIQMNPSLQSLKQKQQMPGGF
jgi:tetratricopeptide (TPR) repeat protein